MYKPIKAIGNLFFNLRARLDNWLYERMRARYAKRARKALQARYLSLTGRRK